MKKTITYVVQTGPSAPILHEAADRIAALSWASDRQSRYDLPLEVNKRYQVQAAKKAGPPKPFFIYVPFLKPL